MGVEKENSIDQDINMLDTDHSLNSENGSLEEYGVWVKSGPEDIEEPADSDSFSLENLPDAGESASFLTDEEEQLLGDLETDIPEEDAVFDDDSFMDDESETEEDLADLPDMSALESDESIEEDFTLEDLDDLSDLNDLDDELSSDDSENDDMETATVFRDIPFTG